MNNASHTSRQQILKKKLINKNKINRQVQYDFGLI